MVKNECKTIKDLKKEKKPKHSKSYYFPTWSSVNVSWTLFVLSADYTKPAPKRMRESASSPISLLLSIDDMQ